jgi:hypothetical protein
MWEFIDKACYINLDHRTDRKEAMLNFFKTAGIPGEKVQRIPAAYTPHNGMIGCAKSHIAALELAKANNWKSVLITEDDLEWVNFEDNYPKLEELLSSTKWDVCMLTGYYLLTTPPKISSAIYTNAYIVQNHYYDTLIQNMKESLSLKEETLRKEKVPWLKATLHPLYKHIYNVDVYWIKLQLRDNWIAMVPIMCQQIECYSDINNKIMRPPCGVSLLIENYLYIQIINYFKGL